MTRGVANVVGDPVRSTSAVTITLFTAAEQKGLFGRHSGECFQDVEFDYRTL